MNWIQLLPDESDTVSKKVVLVVCVISKVKWSRYRPGVAQKVGRGIALLFHDRGTRRGWVVSTSRPHFTPGKDPVHILHEGWAPEPVWTGEENLVPTGILSRTVQPVVSHYTYWATPATKVCNSILCSHCLNFCLTESTMFLLYCNYYCWKLLCTHISG